MFSTLLYTILIIIGIVTAISTLYIVMIAVSTLRVLSFFHRNYGQWQSWESVSGIVFMPRSILTGIISFLVEEKILDKRKDQQAINEFIEDLNHSFVQLGEILSEVEWSDDDLLQNQAIHGIMSHAKIDLEEMHINLMSHHSTVDSDMYWLFEYRMIHRGGRRRRRKLNFWVLGEGRNIALAN